MYRDSVAQWLGMTCDLDLYGVPKSNVNETIESIYISGRSFFVRVGLSSAPVTQASSGVPQRSVRGPILFTTYVASIGRLINSYGINYYKYADDSQHKTTLVNHPETISAASSLAPPAFNTDSARTIFC